MRWETVSLLRAGNCLTEELLLLSKGFGPWSLLVGRFVGWFGLLVGWLVGWLGVWVGGWLFGGLVGWLFVVCLVG
jgi:hypothetical protein